MLNVLDKYGIKEVADGTLYNILNTGGRGAPALYLDSLKVSTVEQTAEEVAAEGGKGNSKLISWDYGKDITLNFEDALFSMKSLSIMFGNGTVGSVATIDRTVEFMGKTVPTQWNGPQGKKYDIKTPKLYSAMGEEVQEEALEEGERYFATFQVPVEGQEIEVSAESFPGTYYITGDTYARSYTTGQDEFFQFIVPKGKISSENTLTMEAAGDPSVFNMTVTVLRPDDRVMMRLYKYDPIAG